MYKKSSYLLIVLIIISTIFLGVGYASVSNIDLTITGDATISPSENIEIISIQYKESSNPDLASLNSLNITKNIMQSKIQLNRDKDAYVTYTVTVKNNTPDDLNFIDVIKNNNFYTNNNDTFNSQIVYEIEGISTYEEIYKDGGTLTFDIKFKYNVANTEEILFANEILNSYLNFRFRKTYSITYNGFINNDYPSRLIVGEDYTIDFVDDIPDNILVTGEADSLYRDGVLTIKNVKSDIVVTKIEGVG